MCKSLHTTRLRSGPLLYILYTAELEHVVTQHGMRLRQYADDSQLYLHVTVRDTVVAVQCFTACVSNVNDWMRASRLRLNPAKTELMWLGFYHCNSSMSTSMTFQYCRCKLKSLKLLVALELSSTASCHYRHMLLRFVELDSFTSDNYVQLFDQ